MSCDKIECVPLRPLLHASLPFDGVDDVVANSTTLPDQLQG
jgi:hypothetical protein